MDVAAQHRPGRRRGSGSAADRNGERNPREADAGDVVGQCRFPSAASIPPVSIMTNEPAMAQGGTDAERRTRPLPHRAAHSNTPGPMLRAAPRGGNAAPPTSAQ